jgi:hypothetical protein
MTTALKGDNYCGRHLRRDHPNDRRLNTEIACEGRGVCPAQTSSFSEASRRDRSTSMSAPHSVAENAGQRRSGERNQRAITTSARKRRGSRTKSRISLAVFTRDMLFTAIFRERVVVRKAIAVVRVAGDRPTRCSGHFKQPAGVGSRRTTGRGPATESLGVRREAISSSTSVDRVT